VAFGYPHRAVSSPHRTAALVCSCALAAIALAACGSTAKPLAGSPGVATAPGIHGKIDDPRSNVDDHVACLKQSHLMVTLVGQTDMRIGMAPAGPYVHFAPTPGAAQADQISGVPKFLGAEVIGSALLWPNGGSASVLKTVETCLAQGVAG
jgi:hypothetical protein